MPPTPPPVTALPAPPPAWWLLALSLATLVPLALIGWILLAVQGRRSSLLLGLLITQLVFLLPALAWARLSGCRPLRLLRLVRPSPGGLLLGLGVGVGAIVAGAGVMALWRTTLPASVLERFDVGQDLMSQGWSPALLLGLAAVLPALCEEIAFRGALQTALLRGRSPARAIAIGASIFAVVHFDPVRLPGVLLVGLAFGWLAWRTGSLWPPVLAHAVNNGAAVLISLQAAGSEAGAADPTETLTAPEAVQVLAVGLALLTAAVSAARRWLPPPPDAVTFLVPRIAATGGSGSPGPTTAGAAPSPSGSAPP